MKKKTFGRYNIIKKVGQGGMGVVYKAFDPELGREVALKVLYGEEDLLIQARERFLIEAKATAKLQHPNIIKIHDFGVEQNQYFFTMEFIEGRSLHEVCKKSLPPVRRIADIMMKVARAIHHAHEQGVIHRDIKPGNIMIDKFHEPKVMDFGLAKIEHTGKRLSKAGMIIGTVEYMSPEQARGLIKDVDALSDVYGLGATLYHLMTGRAPFVGGDSFKLLYHIVNTYPVPPSTFTPRISTDLEYICMKALEKSKKHRYQSAAALADDLEKFISGKSVDASAYGVFQKLHKKFKQHWISATFYILVTFFSIAGVIYYSNIESEPSSSFKSATQETHKENVQRIPPEYICTRQIGSENDRQSSDTDPVDMVPVACVTDRTGNLYLTGQFKSTVNFGKDWQKEDRKVSSGGMDIFITRINSDHSYAWTRTIGWIEEEVCGGAQIDSSNNLYVAGVFKYTVNFMRDWGGRDEKCPPGKESIFITKIYSDGRYGYTKTFPGDGFIWTIDSHDNLYVLARKKDLNGNYNFRLIPVNTDVSVEWSTHYLFPGAITTVTDNVDNIYIMGGFTGRRNFSMDARKTDIKTSAGDQDVYITKVIPNGWYGWTKCLGALSPNKCEGSNLATDINNNVYVTGVFSGQVDFGRDWGRSDIKTSEGRSDIFVTKITSDGAYCWTRCIGGSSEKNNPSLAVDRYGNLYICGHFKNTLELGKDWCETIENKKSAGDQDIFITKVYSDGNYGWTKSIGGPGYDRVKDLAVDREFYIYLYGYFFTPVDFGRDWGRADKRDPGIHADIFITKIR